MSNVRITAIDDEGLSIAVLLGDVNRGWFDVEAGESVDLAVGGNQTLSIGPAREPADPDVFVTPDDQAAVTTPFVEGVDDLPIGVDVLPEGQESPADPALDEIQTELPFTTEEANADAEVIKELAADSPLEVGAISDLPDPFAVEGDVEEAEDTGSEAQA